MISRARSQRSITTRPELRVSSTLLLIALLASTAVGLRAGRASTDDSLVFTPVADTYVDASLPDSSFGTLNQLWVDSSPAKQSFLRFQVSGLSGRTVTGVHLRLYQTDSSDSGGRIWTTTSTTWSDASTWNTRPAIDGSLLATLGPVNSGTSYDVDLGLSSLAGDGEIDLALDSTSADGARWASRENVNPPQLVVTLASNPPPTNADGFTITPAADTYVDASMPDSAFGTLASFWTDNSPTKTGYLRFVTDAVAGRTVLDVRLRMYQVDASPNGGRVSSISSTGWSESMTWNTRAAIDGSQLGNFSPVTANTWYEADLGTPSLSSGFLSLAVDSTDADGARWATRESGNPPQLLVFVAKVPGLVLDGLTQITPPAGGSSAPTYFAGQHRVVVTKGGRELVVYGHHASGVQLAWRDPGAGWQTRSTGAVADGQVLSGTGTGDWPASIALAPDSQGVEHAWVVWARASFLYASDVQMRRLSDLDAAGGPAIGPLVTVEPAGLGNSRVDLAFEAADMGGFRGAVLWTEKTSNKGWEYVTQWFTNLDSDVPTFSDRHVLFQASSDSLGSGSLAQGVYGLRAIVIGEGGTLQAYGHDTTTMLTEWWSGERGVTVSPTSKPTAIALASGDLIATVESSVSKHKVTVERFDPTGHGHQVQLTLSGYAMPSMASDGANAYLLMVRLSDGVVVSRFGQGPNGDSLDWGLDRVEIGPEGGGNYAWPNPARATDGRLRFIVQGPSGSATQTAVLAFQRPL